MLAVALWIAAVVGGLYYWRYLLVLVSLLFVVQLWLVGGLLQVHGLDQVCTIPLLAIFRFYYRLMRLLSRPNVCLDSQTEHAWNQLGAFVSLGLLRVLFYAQYLVLKVGVSIPEGINQIFAFAGSRDRWFDTSAFFLGLLTVAATGYGDPVTTASVSFPLLLGLAVCHGVVAALFSL